MLPSDEKFSRMTATTRLRKTNEPMSWKPMKYGTAAAEPQVAVVHLPPAGAGSGGAAGAPVLILASDGVWGLLEDGEAAAIATAHADDPQAAADALMAEVSRRGGRDNASVIVAAWGGGGGATT